MKTLYVCIRWVLWKVFHLFGRKGLGVRVPLAPLPSFRPITAETRCGHCDETLMDPDGKIGAAEWETDGWYHQKCLQKARRLKANAERYAANCIRLTDEQRAAEVAGRFRNF